MIENIRYYYFKKASLIIICLFYIAAGINHFWHSQNYLNLIPPYIFNKPFVNIFSGIFEIVAGILMMFKKTRKLSAIILISLLILFIPAHIYMIQLNGCVSKSLCVPEWLAWIRLFPFQFILIWWAWKTYKWNTK